MAKRSIKAVRRSELMGAAIAVVGEEGLAGATMAAIARRAGMSVGLVNHYFDGKDELMALAMRNLSNLFRQDILKVMPSNPAPAERLKAIIDGSFAPHHLGEPKRAAAWMQFMAASQTDPRIKHLYDLTGARFVSNIRYAVRQLVPECEMNDTVDAIAALIDGFFWQIAGRYEEEDLAQARRICWRYVLLLIPALKS